MVEERFSEAKMRRMVSLLVFMVMMVACKPAVAISNVSNKLDIDGLLKRLNKPALKSIKSPDGDIIDCVNVRHQPAFDHPLMQNHTIQVRPSFYPTVFGGISNNSSKPKQNNTQLWHLSGRCPRGTIPIRRTKKADVLRAKSIQAFGKKNSRTIPQPVSKQPKAAYSGHEYAVGYLVGERYYGTKVSMNVWDPQIQRGDEFSLAQIWITAGSYSANDLNTIEVGWQVYPYLYGDSNTRLFTYWTSDAYETTGCYNLFCSGFVQTSNDIAMGATLYPTSKYANTQYEMTILIWQDGRKGNWWMQLGDSYVGYWPASMFSRLSNEAGANEVEWGGEIVNLRSDGQHTSTQMGSGHFPEEKYGKVGYFRNIQYVDGSNYLRDAKGVGKITPNSNCYNLQHGYTGSSWSTYFYYGGPGRNSYCP